MKGYEWIGWLATVFLGFTIVNRVLGGGWLSSADVEILNEARITQNVSFGFFSVPLPNTNYFHAILMMFKGEQYTFFQGNAQIFYFIFQTVTFMIGFAILVLLISIAVNAIRTR